MTEGRTENRILTIPNLVSLARLAMIPVFWWLLLARGDVAGSAWLIFVVGWTDWVDGYLARRLDQVSVLGAILDPVADRLMIASAVLGGLVAGVVPVLVAAPLIAREALMGLIVLYMSSRRAQPLAVRYLGKVATFILYGAIPSFYLAAAGLAPSFFEPVAWITAVTGLALYWYVLIQYLGDARVALAYVESPPKSEES